MAKRVKDNSNWVRTFEVLEPTRHRRGFTVYKVTSTVFPKSFPESATKITVWKRYSDFKKLHKDLEQIFKQLYLKGDFPVFPKAKLFGRFEHEVVEERRKAALVLLEFTAKYTQLFTSKAFLQFFENGYKTEDFIGKIFFRSEECGGAEPPTDAIQERSDISTPCLEPEVLWDNSHKRVQEEDSTSLSISSISSSLSPENPEAPTSPGVSGTGVNGAPCTATNHGHDLVQRVANANNGTINIVETLSSQTTDHGEMEVAKPKSTILKSVSSQSHSSSLIPTTSQIVHTDQDVRLPCSSSSSRGNGIVRSATVTDDLNSYFDDEFEDAAFLFPTASCASLDAIPGFTQSSEDGDSVHSKESSASNKTGLFSLSRRKNGFGFFDFLPLFPKKSKKKQEKEKEKEKEKKSEKTDMLSVGYICEAAGHFAVAQFHESNMEYEDAFGAYKEGIRVLLAGAQGDTDRDRKVLAKNKLEKYLSRAESLKENYLSPAGAGGVSPVFSSPNKKANCLSFLSKPGESSSHTLDGLSLLSNLEELKMFKVVGRVPSNSNVLIVMNPEEESPKCYATKVLWKSSCVVFPDKPTIVPTSIPFMTKLLKWFETSDKIVLLLEYVGGGRLIDFVTNYQSKRISFVSPPEDDTPVDDQPTLEKGAIEHSSNAADAGNGAVEAPKDTNEDQDLEFSRDVPQVSSIVINDENLTTTDPDLNQDNVIGNNCPSGTIPPSVTPLTADVDSDSHSHETDKGENANVDLLEVTKLLENSKMLLETVTKTLEESSSPRKMSRSSQPNDVSEKPTNAFKASVQATLEASENVNPKPCRSKKITVQNQSPVTDESPEDMEELLVPKRMVPEGCVRVWAAETILALEALHDIGITYGDLDITDILLGENGHISLNYKSLWKDVDEPVSTNSYSAPEVRFSIGIPLWKIHSSADWWSLGAILFHLFTGQSFHSAHPEGIFPEMIIKVPDTAINGNPISRSARTLLSELLQFNPELRLGYYGAAEIKSHPFFETFDWEKALEDDSCDTKVLTESQN